MKASKDQVHTARAWRRRIAVAFAIAGVVLGLGALLPFLILRHGDDATKVSEIKSDPFLRTVIVLEPGESPAKDLVRARQCRPWLKCRNGQDGVDIAILKSGTAPSQPVKAVVETDSNCTPDEQGISHCSNQLRLASGETIEVQHDHDMNAYPCLKPGEAVEVKPQSSI